MSRILVVDDEQDIRDFAICFLVMRGIKVLTAAVGIEALDIIDKQKPDLVLLDIHMEEMTGVEVLKELRQNKNDIKVIMVTGVEEEATVNEANSWGIRGYIHKPLVLEELEKIVIAELGTGRH